MPRHVTWHAAAWQALTLAAFASPVASERFQALEQQGCLPALPKATGIDGMQINWPMEGPPDESPATSVLDLPIPRELSSNRSSLHLADVGNEDVGDTELEIQQIIPRIAKEVARMEITNPEVLRVTCAYQCLEERGLAFRGSKGKNLFFEEPAK
eukprot:Skav201643  [mRNA]  locus=scaffold3087:209387:210706:+ [translate_table: standard]